ncbi:MAG: drug/metabolite transporter (DMT)-like permease [Janthinobacterium sp.]
MSESDYIIAICQRDNPVVKFKCSGKGKPMGQRQELDQRAGAMMLVLCAIWGMQQVAMKAAAPDIAPVLQVALRSGIAALMVCVLMLARGERIVPRDGTWRPGLLVGLLFALEFLLVSEGLQYTSASHMVMFLYTAPIFAALGLHWKVPAERLKPAQWLGIAIAFSGIIAAFAGRTQGQVQAGAPNVLLGDLFGVAAAMAWGATTVVVRCSSLATAPVARTLLYQLVGAFVLLTLVTLALGRTEFTLTPVSMTSMLYQTFLVSFASFLAWFWLLRHYLASRLGVLSFMAPMFGIGFGVWLLGEPLERNFIVGALLVMLGILLVSGHEWLMQMVRRRRNA